MSLLSIPPSLPSLHCTVGTPGDIPMSPLTLHSLNVYPVPKSLRGLRDTRDIPMSTLTLHVLGVYPVPKSLMFVGTCLPPPAISLLEEPAVCKVNGQLNRLCYQYPYVFFHPFLRSLLLLRLQVPFNLFILSSSFITQLQLAMVTVIPFSLIS